MTSDPNDPRLPPGRPGGDEVGGVPQRGMYLVISREERARGFVRPYRDEYRHLVCGETTTLSKEIAETFAANPSFYGSTYCAHCRAHDPVKHFVWIERVQKRRKLVDRLLRLPSRTERVDGPPVGS